LHDKITGQVLRFSFTAFFAPEAHKGRLVGAHDDASVRATNEPRAGFDKALSISSASWLLQAGR
jgi:hypothetical protein